MELETREQLRQAICDGQPGLLEFQRLFMAVADAVEAGRDADARETVTGLLPHLQQFSRYCLVLHHAGAEHLAEAEQEALLALTRRLLDCLQGLASAWQTGDLVAVGDSMRLDLAPLFGDYHGAFQSLAASLGVPAAEPVAQPAEAMG